MGVRVNPNKRTLKNVYRTYIDVMNYVKTSVSSFNIDDKNEDDKEQDQKDKMEGNEDEKMLDERREADHGRQEAVGLNDDKNVFTEEEIRKFKEFAAKPEHIDLLVDALAPSIWENEDVKKGILCQLFGGVSKELAGGQGRMRGEINVLLCGDPSTAKSQLH